MTADCYLKNLFIVIVCIVCIDEKAVNNNEREDRWTVRSFLGETALLSVISGGNGSLYGITVLSNQLFVIRDRPTKVSIYNTNNFTLTHYLLITGSSGLCAIVASPRYNCLYISDIKLNVVHKYNLSNNVNTKGSVGEECFGLSLTCTDNTLVTLWNTKQINEYTPDRVLIREISLNRGIEYPQHCVQVSNDRFVVSDWRSGSLSRVCPLDTSGRIIQYYGGTESSGVAQLDGPRHLAVDGHGNVLVTDLSTNRVVLLSPLLTHLGYIEILGHQLNQPWALHLDELTHRLYIGEWYTGRMIVLTV